MSGDLRKIAVFALVGIGAFLLAFGLGRVAGDSKDAGEGHGDHMSQGSDDTTYSVELLDDASLPLAGTEPQVLRFRVLDPDGRAVTRYETKHEKDLHLIVVEKANPRIYAHLHPALEGGVWSVETRLVGGEFRLFADTTPKGAEAQVLTADFSVDGDHRVDPAMTTNDVASVGGYDIALKADGAAYTFTVTKAGKPVELQPYLGAGGHLVGIRVKTLDYLHAHAEQAEGNTVGFHVEAAKTGTYVLHLDFKVDGVVHSATFVQQLESASSAGGHEGHDMDDMGGMEMEGHDGH